MKSSDAGTIGIDVRGITFSYGPRSVLDAVSLSIPAGRIWALVGRSGAGKTTLLHIISGLYRPTRGSVVIAHREASELGRIRGVVFQDDGLLGWLSVRDNVLFPRYSNADAGMLSRASALLSAVGLAGELDAYPAQLSAGMKKRLEFARALLNDDKYILADEPFGTVDVVTRRKLWHLWQDLRRQQPRTGLLCTHDPEEAVRLCDAVVVLRGTSPTTIGRRFDVPDEIRTLPLDEENEALWSMKRAIIMAIEDQTL